MRLVNCSVALDYKGELRTGAGSWGVPGPAMVHAQRVPTAAGVRVLGVQITDVHTGEKWLWPLEAVSA